MAQWVKNLTVVAQVTAELLVPSVVWHSGLKDLVLPQLQLRFNPWSGNFCMLQVQPLKKKKRIKQISYDLCPYFNFVIESSKVRE